MPALFYGRRTLYTESRSTRLEGSSTRLGSVLSPRIRIFAEAETKEAADELVRIMAGFAGVA